PAGVAAPPSARRCRGCGRCAAISTSYFPPSYGQQLNPIEPMLHIIAYPESPAPTDSTVPTAIPPWIRLNHVRDTDTTTPSGLPSNWGYLLSMRRKVAWSRCTMHASEGPPYQAIAAHMARVLSVNAGGRAAFC